MNHPLQCRCGKLKGHVAHPRKASRGVCYCRDCQAYAHFLGKADEILDEAGGSDVIATLPKYVAFTDGVENLTCMSLSPKGILRWYANCCNTPIGNTVRNYKVSYVGLLHSCLGNSQALNHTFGPVRLVANAKSAHGTPRSMPISTFLALLRFFPRLLRARLDGSYKRTPFFVPERGTPVVTPKVITLGARIELMKLVNEWKREDYRKK